MEQIITKEVLFQICSSFIRILTILLIAGIFLKFSKVIVDKYFLSQTGNKTLYLEAKRARTLTILLYSVIKYTIYFVVLVMILQQFKIDTTSIIAGAGVVGLAVGVGAQSLIKDFITGFFIILEDQYSVGDYIASGDMQGTVQEIGFRVTKLRDTNGVLHIIPNGLISRVTNYSRGHMLAVVNVPVAYTVNLSQVTDLLEQACIKVGKALPEVLDGPKVLGVSELKNEVFVVKIIANTVPLEQAKVEAMLRKTIKEMFEKENIPSPLHGTEIVTREA